MKIKHIILPLLLLSCGKQKDYSYLNTDRRNCKTFVYVSQRFDWYWKPVAVLKGQPETVCDSAVLWLQKIHDTLFWPPGSCPPPDPSMPEFRIEIRYYEE